MKTLIKKIIPKNSLQYYHKGMSLLGALVYNNPSKDMIVIGVTGTNGKSTTVSLISKALEAGGDKVGAMSTVSFKIAGEEKLNDKKMTMLGRFQLHKYMKRMVDAGCKYAVIETSSEGIKQFRHLGINYDYVVFTNLTPEHIESHGSFENYKNAKGELFKHLTKKPIKTLNGKKIPKVIIANKDDKYVDYFMSFNANRKINYSIENNSDFQASNVQVSLSGTSYSILNKEVQLKLIGEFNVYNSLPAIVIAEEEGLDLEKVIENLNKVEVVPGRMEMIDEGQKFSVMVDYAPEPYSMKALYKTIKRVLPEDKKIIHVLGSCGGGRDKARRPILGKMAGTVADIVIIANEDPYNDDPNEIINDVSAGAIEAGKELNTDLYKIEDRKEAIAKALSLANENDLVLVTGKGSEQAMAVADGQYIPWDDREVIREWLKNNI